MGNGTQGGWRSQATSGGGRRATGAAGRPDGERHQADGAAPRGGWQDRQGAANRDGGQGEQRKGPPRGYRDLIVWQKAMDLIPVVYRLVQKLPPDERLALADQLRRAAIAVAANIAAGQASGHPAEFARSLTVARGSLAELDTLLVTGVALGYFQPSELATAGDLIGAVRALLLRLIQRLREGPKERAQPGRGSSPPQ